MPCAICVYGDLTKYPNALKSLPKKKVQKQKTKTKATFHFLPQKKIRKRKNVRDRSQQDFGSLIIWTAGNDNMHTHT